MEDEDYYPEDVDVITVEDHKKILKELLSDPDEIEFQREYGLEIDPKSLKFLKF